MLIHLDCHIFTPKLLEQSQPFNPSSSKLPDPFRLFNYYSAFHLLKILTHTSTALFANVNSGQAQMPVFR